jgi:diaminohydroxyphosphoribosylaminopyrimidine deaminase/5-amino-6-(5-phosphoribosylamino)uracil reductase
MDLHTTYWTPADTEYMELALQRARAARGRVAPNPAVGAVLVRDGRVLSVGATQPPPGAHAEVVALDIAGALASGADLYVTLEPCAHVGRTGPCVDAIIRAGVRKVIVAIRDPNPLVNGRGIARLRGAGVQVDVGLGADAALELIAGFRKRITTGRPLVTAKYAMTLDGRIATRTGHARWVSGPDSRAHAQERRDQIDAILVGIGTGMADDPLLTTRLPANATGYGGLHHPLRVVLDTQARTPLTARMLADGTPGTTLILVGESAPCSRIEALEAAGVEVVPLPTVNAHVDLRAALDLLGSRGVNDLLVEGGGETHGSFFDAHLVNHVNVYVAPLIVGGCGARAPVGGIGVSHMPDATRIVNRSVSMLGEDLYVDGDVCYGESAEVGHV